MDKTMNWIIRNYHLLFNKSRIMKIDNVKITTLMVGMDYVLESGYIHTYLGNNTFLKTKY